MSPNALVELEEVSKVYSSGLLGRNRLRALSGVTLRVEPGQVFGLVGPNRAGKTTLVKVLLSLCRPTAGKAFRFGQPVSDRRTLARVGYVHENHAFPRYLTATRLLEFFGALAQVPRREVRQRVPKLLELVGLADRADEPISRFSKGMVQRLGLAQALLNGPELLVLDEPSEGLDFPGRQTVRDVIVQQRREGRSVLLITHLMAEVDELCDRIGVLVAGRLVYSGTPAGLRKERRQGQGGSLEQALQELYQRQAS